MKITTDKQNTKFQPVTISMTFESQLELDVMGSLFNSCIIADYLSDNGINNYIYASFKESGANIYNVEGVNQSIKNHPNFKN